MHNKNYNPLKVFPPNIDSLSLNLVREKSKVLELGCSSGYLGSIMRNQFGCSVIGVDIDKNALKIAKKKLNKTLLGSIEDENIFRKIREEGPYDIIFTSAVLEHLLHPDIVLNNLTKLLKKDGFFIITLPNIAHWTARMSLFKGKFEYTDSGLFDKTHLHFFTLKTAKELIEKAGLKIVEEKYEFFGPKPFSLFFKPYPNLFAYQLLFKAVPKS